MRSYLLLDNKKGRIYAAYGVSQTPINKNIQRGVETICKAMEEMRNETAHEKAVEIAERMLKSGKLSYEEIAEFAELTIEEVKALNEKGIA